MERKGFTLIEILVVLAITALLSGLAIVFTHVGQNQISLSVEEEKIAQLILEARELSVATYGTGSTTSDTVCAYGVSFDYKAQSYSLFSFDDAVKSLVPGGRPICPSIASTTVGGIAPYRKIYQSGSWNVRASQGVVLEDSTNSASNTIEDVLFYPPDPCMLISYNDKTFISDCAPNGVSLPPESYIYMSTIDGSLSRSIMVNPVGQVSL